MHILIVCVKLLKPAFPQFQLPLLSEHQCCGLQYQSEFKTKTKVVQNKAKVCTILMSPIEQLFKMEGWKMAYL